MQIIQVLKERLLSVSTRKSATERKKKVLFVFWHGLGDNILATPAIKKYKLMTGNYIGWAMLRRFKKAKLFEENPYIDQLHWISDAWNDFKNYKNGLNRW
jgi:ADP-heptose:LPS heptosyltransferase